MRIRRGTVLPIACGRANLLAATLLLATAVVGGSPKPAGAASLSASVIDHTVCRLDRGTQSAPPATSCSYDAGSERGSGIGTSTVSGSGSSVVTTDLDGAVVSDLDSAAVFNDLRFWLDFDFDVVLDVDVATPTTPWQVIFEQSALGLHAIVDDGAGSGATDFFPARIDVQQVSGPGFDLTLSPGSLGAQNADTSIEFSGARSDVLTGTGDATLTFLIRATLRANSNCPFTGCTNADEAAILFGIDDASGSTATSVDEYATWGRTSGDDGYRAVFTLVPEPTTALLLATGLTALAARRRRLH